MTQSRHEDFLPTDDESDSTTDKETESLFDESDNDTADTDGTQMVRRPCLTRVTVT